MKTISLFLLLSVVLFATGCPNEPSKNLSGKNTTAAQISNRVNTYLTERQNSYYASLSADGKKAQRDDAIEYVLALVDSNYQDYITRLQTRRSTFDFVADVVELGTSAAAGIAKGERPNQILGIALTAFRGGRRSVELNFYKEQTVPILITKMDGNRATVYAEILQKKARPVEEYSITEAIRDMVAYYNAGTLVRAFTELQKDTADQTKAEEANLEVLKGVRTARRATQAERDVVVEEVQPILEALSEDLSGTDATEKAKATTKVKNIVLALEKDTDPALLAELKKANVTSTETDGMKLFRALRTLRRAIPTDSPLQGKINRAIIVAGK